MMRLFFAAVATASVCWTAAQAQDELPVSGAVLWLKGDAGIVEDDFGVQTWEDQSGNGFDAIRAEGVFFAGDPLEGTMSPDTREFPGGEREVVRFYGDGWFEFQPDAEDAFDSQDITVYAVIEATDEPSENGRMSYFSNYSNAINWGYGYHLDLTIGDTVGVRAFSSAGSGESISDMVAASPSPPGSMLFLSTVISASDGEKLWYENNQLLQQEEIFDMVFNLPDDEIGGDGRASIGTLSNFSPNMLQPQDASGDFFMMRGDIAEIIVYPAAHDPADLDAVFDYLDQRYNQSVSALPWDFSGNDVVDFADFVMFSNVFGQSGEGDNAKFDLSGNGTIDFADFVDFSNHFGEAAGVANVPEPGTGLLLLTGGLLAVLRRSKKR